MEESIFRQGIYAYCGNVGKVTDDHVIPQCLWPGRVAKDAPIIDACVPCNNVWNSEYDTYLRDFLVNDAAAASSPIIQKLREKFYRSVGRNQSMRDGPPKNHPSYIEKVCAAFPGQFSPLSLYC